MDRHVNLGTVLAAAALVVALMFSLLGCAHQRIADEALNARCLRACNGWHDGGVVAKCGETSGVCTCMALDPAAGMTHIYDVCPRRVRL